MQHDPTPSWVLPLGRGVPKVGGRATENILQIAKTPFLTERLSPYVLPNICRRAVTPPVLPMTNVTTPSPLMTDQLNSTALKWGDDGELSDLDLQRILRLLSQADPVAEALLSAAEESRR